MKRLSKNQAREFSKLNQRKWRMRNRLFIAEGSKCIMDLLPSFTLHKLIIKENTSVTQMDATYRGIFENIESDSVLTASVADFKSISTLATPTDYLAIFEIPESEDNTEVLELDDNGLYLLLDNVRDPGNLGTIMRTAYWFGVDCIFASHGTADIYNAKTVQATMGALGHIKVVYTDLLEIINNNESIPVFGTFMQGDNIFTSDLPKAGMIIMGNEGVGISQQLIPVINHRISIPPYNEAHPESLNVSVATSIVLAFFRK